jgi:alpha-galactosidase
MVALGDESARGARNALATSSQRLWLRPAIDTDPDVAYFGRERIDLDERTIGALQDLAQVAGFLGVSDPPSALSVGERDELADALSAKPTVVHVDRYRWRLDDRLVDFSWVFDRDAVARPGGRL